MRKSVGVAVHHPLFLAACAGALASFACMLASCASRPEAVAVQAPAADYLDKRGIIELFKRDTGLHILEDVKAVEYFQNEISPGYSILKLTLFLTEDDANSVLAQKPPFSSEWTHTDIYRDYRGEWLNLQRLKLDPYASLFRNERIDPKPLTDRGYASRSGSLQEGDRTMRILFVNRENCTITYYVMKNAP